MRTTPEMLDSIDENPWFSTAGDIRALIADARTAHALMAERTGYDMGAEVTADHSAGLRCHKCDGRLLPPGGLGGCAACKQVSAAENLKNEEETRGTSAATPPPDSDIRQALDEALPGWDDPDERVTIAEAIRLIHQDRASIKAAAERC